MKQKQKCERQVLWDITLSLWDNNVMLRTNLKTFISVQTLKMHLKTKTSIIKRHHNKQVVNEMYLLNEKYL